MSELIVLRDLRKFICFIYSFTSKFPKHEDYCLTSQIRRAIISVSLNIREGNGFYDNNKIRFFKIAYASLQEVEECYLIAKELNYIENNISEEFYIHYWKCYNKLNSLIKSNSQILNLEK